MVAERRIDTKEQAGAVAEISKKDATESVLRQATRSLNKIFAEAGNLYELSRQARNPEVEAGLTGISIILTSSLEPQVRRFLENLKREGLLSERARVDEVGDGRFRLIIPKTRRLPTPPDGFFSVKDLAAQLRTSENGIRSGISALPEQVLDDRVRMGLRYYYPESICQELKKKLGLIDAEGRSTDDWLSLSQLAKKLGFSVTTVRSWASSLPKELQAKMLRRGRLLVFPPEVVSVLQETKEEREKVRGTAGVQEQELVGQGWQSTVGLAEDLKVSSVSVQVAIKAFILQNGEQDWKRWLVEKGYRVRVGHRFYYHPDFATQLKAGFDSLPAQRKQEEIKSLYEQGWRTAQEIAAELGLHLTSATTRLRRVAMLASGGLKSRQNRVRIGKQFYYNPALIAQAREYKGKSRSASAEREEKIKQLRQQGWKTAQEISEELGLKPPAAGIRARKIAEASSEDPEAWLSNGENRVRIGTTVYYSPKMAEQIKNYEGASNVTTTEPEVSRPEASMTLKELSAAMGITEPGVHLRIKKVASQKAGANWRDWLGQRRTRIKGKYVYHQELVRMISEIPVGERTAKRGGIKEKAPEGLLTTAQVASELGVSERTVKRLIQILPLKDGAGQAGSVLDGYKETVDGIVYYYPLIIDRLKVEITRPQRRKRPAFSKRLPSIDQKGSSEKQKPPLEPQPEADIPCPISLKAIASHLKISELTLRLEIRRKLVMTGKVPEWMFSQDLSRIGEAFLSREAFEAVKKEIHPSLWRRATAEDMISLTRQLLLKQHEETLLNLAWGTTDGRRITPNIKGEQFLSLITQKGMTPNEAIGAVLSG